MNEFNNFLKAYFMQHEVKDIDIETGIDLFIFDFSKMRRPSTIQYYKDHLKPFKLFCKQRKLKTFLELNNDHILAYSHLLGYSNENLTINKKLSVVKMVLNYLKANNYISDYNLTFPKFEVKQKPIKCINDKDLKLLISSLEDMNLRQKLIVYLIISTGIRRNELVNILVKNIDFDNKRIYLEYTKTHSPRYIYLNDYLIRLIKEIINKNKQKVYLFESKFGNQLSSSYVTYLFFTLKNDLKINYLSAHKLRHTFATYLLKHGANQEHVRRLLGHTDFKMTKRYIDYVDDDLKSAAVKFGPMELINSIQVEN